MREDLALLLRESGLPADEFGHVVAALDELRSTAPPPPTPSADLAALLAGGARASGGVAPAPGVRPRRRLAVVLGGLALGLAGGAVAGAANALPEPVQEFVADFSESFLPFEFPHPSQPGEPDSPRFEVPGEGPVLAPTRPAAPGDRTRETPDGGATSGESRTPDTGSPTPSAVPPPVATPPAESAPSQSGPPDGLSTQPPAPGRGPDGGPGPGPGQQAPQAAPQAPAPADDDAGGGPGSQDPQQGLVGLTGELASGVLDAVPELLS